MKTTVLLAKLYIVGMCFCSFLACTSDITKTMDANEKAYNARMKHELITAMSLEEMFPDPSARALADSAAKGNLTEVDRLVQHGVNVNSRGTQGVTPLFWAMHNLDGFNHLLEIGADPNIIFADGSGDTIVSMALDLKDDRFLAAALQHKANPNLVYNDNYETALFRAADFSNRKVDMLLDAGADINAKNRVGNTPAMSNAAIGGFEVVYHLLVRGCDSHAKNIRGQDLRSITAHMLRVTDPKSPYAVWTHKVRDWLDAEDAKARSQQPAEAH